jgi:hypothetical protein
MFAISLTFVSSKLEQSIFRPAKKFLIAFESRRAKSGKENKPSRKGRSKAQICI